jgi:hypothetical protein
MRKISVFVLSLVLGFYPLALRSQQSSDSSQIQGMSLAVQAFRALTSGSTVNDVTLTGTARRIAGSDDETGAVVLKAMAGGNSRVDLTLPSGARSEVRTNSSAGPAGSWSGVDGVSHPISEHNLMTDSSWFFPALLLGRIISTQGFLVSYVGQETRNGGTVAHLAASQQVTGVSAKSAAMIQHLSQMDIFLDATTFLPSAIVFNIHPDDNALLDIPIEVRFSDYRAVNGAQVPFHVQKYLNNGLVLDFQAQSVTLNTGLAASSFSL